MRVLGRHATNVQYGRAPCAITRCGGLHPTAECCLSKYRTQTEEPCPCIVLIHSRDLLRHQDRWFSCPTTAGLYARYPRHANLLSEAPLWPIRRTAHDIRVRDESSRRPPRLRRAQTWAAPAQGRDDLTAIGPRVATGTTPRTTGPSTAALWLNRDRYLSACGCTVPRANHRVRTDDDTSSTALSPCVRAQGRATSPSPRPWRSPLAMRLANPYIPSGVEER